MSGGWFTNLLNCRLCIDGELVDGQMVVSDDTGLILKRTGFIGGDAVDLEGAIVAPGFRELQTNGMKGFHFTHFEDEEQYAKELEKVASYLVTGLKDVRHVQNRMSPLNKLCGIDLQASITLKMGL
ncbi:hypothetical protein B0A49_11430 [Cryomyces minteri]|uniref:N-acetylglucosamine-6-phosphate deacetylase n=1 Tax=Cryomyces minteri TaxID=331657 RepID=A0A4U0XDT6_9PEZI|nr:hypothetical protein B0A49_11430 [Cryomyces minteri]